MRRVFLWCSTCGYEWKEEFPGDLGFTVKTSSECPGCGGFIPVDPMDEEYEDEDEDD